MAKVLVSLNERLLARLDRAARRAGLSRSAYLARLVQRDLGEELGPGASPEAHAALDALKELFRQSPTPGDPVALIRAERESH